MPSGASRATTWRRRVEALLPGARLARGASPRALDRVSTVLHATLPADLRDLLRGSNGIRTAGGSDAVWGAGDIITRNRALRDLQRAERLYLPFGDVLFFGEAGNGDLFGYALRDEAVTRPPVLRWDHETDERVRVAEDLEGYLRLVGAEEPVAGAARPRGAADVRRLVSVWVGTFDSGEALRAYVAPGGSGHASADGLPLSRFQSDFALGLGDVLGTEQHVLFSPESGTPRRVLRPAPGFEALVEGVARAIMRLGVGPFNAAILVYGLRYGAAREAPATGDGGRRVTFVGCHELE